MPINRASKRQKAVFINPIWGNGTGIISRMHRNSSHWPLLALMVSMASPLAEAAGDTSIIALSSVSGNFVAKATQPTQAVDGKTVEAASMQITPAEDAGGRMSRALPHEMSSALHAVSRIYKIPMGLLRAISLTESGLWPWSLNVYGQGYHYDSRQAMLRAVHQFFSKGVSMVDIGPMQVDWHYHGWRFGSVQAAANPLRNIAVAGRLLRDNYQKTGSWQGAVGLYHGGSPGRQNRYIQKVFSRWTTRNSPLPWQGAWGTGIRMIPNQPAHTTLVALSQPSDGQSS